MNHIIYIYIIYHIKRRKLTKTIIKGDAVGYVQIKRYPRADYITQFMEAISRGKYKALISYNKLILNFFTNNKIKSIIVISRIL